MKTKQNLDLKNGSSMQKRGAAGERRAAFYLRLHGYRILERNWLSGKREVDIIASKGDTIAFIEVKSRKAGAITPQLSVTNAKRRNIISASYAYAAKHGIHNAVLRYDIIEVDLDKRFPLSGINHIIGAFCA